MCTYVAEPSEVGIGKAVLVEIVAPKAAELRWDDCCDEILDLRGWQ